MVCSGLLAFGKGPFRRFHHLPNIVKRMLGKYLREVVRSGSIGSSIAPMMEPALIKNKNSDCPVKIYGLM